MLLLAALLCAGRAAAQRLDPDAYRYPIEGVAGLYSANFGEIRPGHFHAGVDIKTDGVEGKRVVAVMDGYVSRVVVQAGGYGRAVYLTLRNGTTAVYGHLQRFREDLEEHVRSERYRRRSNSVDLWFRPDRYPVRQGDLLAFSGNSGSSGGPHLHYEIRDTHDQALRNIVREGIIRPVDSLPPRFVKLHYIEIDSLDGVCHRRTPVSYPIVRTAEGRYRLSRSEALPVGRRGYFVAEVTDRRNGVQNTFAVWRLQASIDGDPYFEFRIDRFTHALSRTCDAVSCYPMQLGSRNEAIRLAQLAGAPDCFYPVMKRRGVIGCRAGERRTVELCCEDDCGNRSHLRFEIVSRDGEFRAEPPADPELRIVRPAEAAAFEAGDFSASIPAGALYDACHAKVEAGQLPKVDSGVVILSPAYRLLDARTPCNSRPRSSSATTAARPHASAGTTKRDASRSKPVRQATGSWRPTRSPRRSAPSSPRAPTCDRRRRCASAWETTFRASLRGASKSTANGFPATATRCRGRSSFISTVPPTAARTAPCSACATARATAKRGREAIGGSDAADKRRRVRRCRRFQREKASTSGGERCGAHSGYRIDASAGYRDRAGRRPLTGDFGCLRTHPTFFGRFRSPTAAAARPKSAFFGPKVCRWDQNS